MQTSLHLRREIKTFWKKYETMLLLVHLSFLHAKHLVIKLFFESLQTYANLLFGPANYTIARCVNPCPPVFKRVGISIQKPVDSHRYTTRPLTLKVWTCLVFYEQDLVVKLRACTLQAARRQLIAAVLIGFVLIAILCLKQWVAFTTFEFVKISAQLSLKDKSNVAVRNKISMNSDEAIYRSKVSLSLKCGNVSGGFLQDSH